MSKEDERYATRMGCQPSPRVTMRWPLGLDLLLKAGRHAKADIILQFFLEVIESSELTHEQRLRESSS